MQIVRYQLVITLAGIPLAVRGLILPSVVPIANMRQRCAICCPIYTFSCRLFMVRVQTHGLPVVYIIPTTTKVGIRLIRSKFRNIYACFGSYTICSCRDFSVVGICVIAILINLTVRNPVFQIDGARSRCVARCISHNIYSIRCIADLSGGCASRYTGEGERGLFGCFLCHSAAGCHTGKVVGCIDIAPLDFSQLPPSVLCRCQFNSNVAHRIHSIRKDLRFSCFSSVRTDGFPSVSICGNLYIGVRANIVSCARRCGQANCTKRNCRAKINLHVFACSLSIRIPAKCIGIVINDIF